MRCGNCFACNNGSGVGPDNAVITLGPGNRFQFDDDCKGCRICVPECLCSAIKMVPEAIRAQVVEAPMQMPAGEAAGRFS